MKPSLPRDYFDELYSQNPDPWNFATKAYEHEKYTATIENLPKEHYNSALELGCSIGVLSAMLGERTLRQLSLDAAAVAIQQAQERCASQPHIRFERATLPVEYPAGQFDLVLMSEVGYYFALPDLKKLSQNVLQSMAPEADLVLVHYLPVVPDYPLTGDEVHDFFRQLPDLHLLSSFRAPRYRFDSFRRLTK